MLEEAIEKYLEVKARADELQTELKEVTKELTLLETEVIPSELERANIKYFETPDGIVCTLKEDLKLSLSNGNKPKAFSWLAQNGYGDLIKNTVSVDFKKGEDAPLQELETLLQERGFANYVKQQNANSASVKALIRRLLKDGVDVPLEDFGAFHYKKAEVKING